MKHDFLVLGGAGMQGRIVTKDLLQSGYRVAVADLDRSRVVGLLDAHPSRSAFFPVDLRNEDETVGLMTRVGASVVINCAEGDWNLSVYRSALRAGAHVIDLGSAIPMTKEQLGLHGKFRDRHLLALTGCGSTPGIANIMLHYAVHHYFDQISSIEAGFVWDSNIKEFVVPFSMQSIMEEFTEHAPFMENGQWKEVRPIDTRIERNFRHVGKQKIFLVRHPETYSFYLYYQGDGLTDIKYYAGFPDHSLRVIDALIDAGFSRNGSLPAYPAAPTPVTYLAELLRQKPIPLGYEEYENIWVSVSGIKNGRDRHIQMECIVSTVPGWEEAGSNIDTGLPASIIAQMILKNEIHERGSFDPGVVVPPELFFREISSRGMKIYANGELLRVSA